MPQFIWLTQISLGLSNEKRPMLVNLDSISYVWQGPHGGAVVGTDGGAFNVVEADTQIATWINPDPTRDPDKTIRNARPDPA